MNFIQYINTWLALIHVGIRFPACGSQHWRGELGRTGRKNDYHICLFVLSVLYIWACREAGGERRCPQLRTYCQLTPLLWSLRCGFRLGMLGYPGDGYRVDRGPDRSWPTLLHRLCQLTVKWTLNGSDTYAASLWLVCSNLRKDKLKACAAIWNQETWNQICQPQIEVHQREGCWNIWPGISGVGGWFCCWWAASSTEKRFAETAHNSSLGTNDSDMQMCLLPFCFPPQPAHKRQGEWKWLIMSLSVSFIYLYAVIKNSFFTKT